MAILVPFSEPQKGPWIYFHVCDKQIRTEEGGAMAGGPVRVADSGLLGCLTHRILELPSPFFLGILLSKKPPDSQGKRIRFLNRTIIAKKGESTPRRIAPSRGRMIETWQT